MDNGTTNLYKLMYESAQFSLGQIIKIHTVGRYTIINFYSYNVAGLPVNKELYATYVDQNLLNKVSVSLDKALLLAISHATIGNEETALDTAVTCSRVIGL